MLQGILYTGTNINRVLEFCGSKASYYAELHVDSIKEKRELVRPTDFIFKSSKGNIRVVSWQHFFESFKKNGSSFDPYCLTYPFILIMKKYIRFGRIPKDERSSIHRRGELVGYEKGVSVWNCYYDSRLKQYVGVMPDNKTEDTEDDFNHYFPMCNRDKIPYLVTGDEVGIGSDNEPLQI